MGQQAISQKEPGEPEEAIHPTPRSFLLHTHARFTAHRIVVFSPTDSQHVQVGSLESALEACEKSIPIQLFSTIHSGASFFGNSRTFSWD
jgi:hypothetical protein